MNRKTFLITAALLLIATGIPRVTTGSRRTMAATRPQGRTATREIIVKLRPGAPTQTAETRSSQSGRIAKLVSENSGQPAALSTVEPLIHGSLSGRAALVVQRAGLDRTFVARLADSTDMGSTISALMASGEVEYAEPNYQVKPASLPASSGLIPNDPQFWNQWALNNPGFNVAGYPSTNGADIKATEAWQITTGNPDVLVAITDTGVDITHPDLAPNIYTNPGEIAGNGVDDDHNGYVDDVTGFDVADNNGDVSDVLGHGTEMAGIIGAVLNNRIGISGICQCKMVPVKFFKKTGPDPTDVAATVADAAKAIIYSITIGASIINASWDVMFEPGTFSPGEPKALRDAVSACNDADVLLVCIAGNDGLSTDINAVYPGHYELPNQIVVAASDYNDDLWHVLGLPSALKSNFGVNTVQIAAPGNLVLTTEAPGDCPLCTQSPDPNSWYTTIDGSSASAAYVSGVAALAKSLFPEANAPVLRRRILESADSIPQLTPYVSNGNRLNALGAVTIQLQITPPVLKKAKYKVSRQVLVLSGTSIQRGAHAIVGGTVYATVPTAGTIVPLQVSLPASVFPSGVAIPVVLRNPDGGTSQTLTITR